MSSSYNITIMLCPIDDIRCNNEWYKLPMRVSS